jgi:hypothetical protein
MDLNCVAHALRAGRDKPCRGSREESGIDPTALRAQEEGDDALCPSGSPSRSNGLSLVMRSICFSVLPSKNSSVLTGPFELATRLRIPRNAVDSYMLLQ